jgi:hypothetical protein
MDPEESSIERLKRSLYSRDESKVPKDKRTPVHGHESDVPTGWGESPSFDIARNLAMTSNSSSFFNKFFIGAVVFFVAALAIAAFFFFGGMNMISSNNVDIRIAAPSEVASGEELDLGLTLVNSNKTDLQEAELYIDYPAGVQSVGAQNIPVAREKVDIGTIPHGGTKDHAVRALILGEKDAVKTLTFTLEYKVKGSNATFSKEKTYDVTIGSSPLLLDVAYPKEANSGQTITVSVDVTSNSSSVVQKGLLKIEYPYGFTFLSSSIKPSFGSNIWSLGDLKNGDKKTIAVTGTLVGQNMEDRSFRVSAGTADQSKKDFDTPLAESIAVVGIRKSFFDLAVSAGDSGVATLGSQVPVSVTWQNTLPDRLVNAQLTATLSGNAFDRSQVSPANGGFYQSSSNTISWDKNTTDGLDSIDPGVSGQVSFTLGSISSPVQIRSVKNPHIDIHLSMTGDRSGQEISSVNSSSDITVKFASIALFTAKSYRLVGPLSNTGPVPPKADKETTYTLTWTITNTSNDLQDGAVTATLPQGVSWKGEVSPLSERISYDPDTRTVSWNTGVIGAGAGFAYSAKEVSFKVGLVPSVTQVHNAPVLVSRTHFSATDTYTSTPVSQDVDPVTTRYSDPGFKLEDDLVVK